MRNKIRNMIVVVVVLLAVSSPSFAWKFASTADSQGGDNGVNVAMLTKIINQINAEGVDLLIMQGDLVSGSSTDSTLASQYDTWKSVMSGLNCPYYVVPGNHDVSTSNSENIWRSKMDMPLNGPTGYQETVWSFDHENAHFVGLNSNHYGEAHLIQEAWLIDDLNNTTQQHIFTMCHEPAFSKGAHMGSHLGTYPAERDDFWNILASHNSGLFFCGHEHYYSFSREGSVYQLINGPSGGGPRGGFPNTIGQYNYVVVTVDGPNLHGVAKNDNGQVIHTWDILPDETPPGPVTNFVATPWDSNVTLSWQNPIDDDFTGTMIRYNTTGYPTSITDGTLLGNKAGLPGASDIFSHSGLTNGATYYYSAFAYDYKPNHAGAAQTSATPSNSLLCSMETFPYADSNLNGNGSWSGSAGAEIAISSQNVKINGGTGDVDAIQSVTCSGDGTNVGVYTKIRAGYGTATMWSMYIDDTSNKNLARWYGSGVSARGCISEGATITPEKALTGNWDDLYVKINFASNTSSFYLNGALIGTLSHAETGAGDSIGRIRFVRNTSPSDNYIFIDNISMGPVEVVFPVATISAPWVPAIKTGSVKYTVTFSEPIYGFSYSDIQVNKTGAVSSGSASISGSNPYTVTIGSVSGNGTISISVKSAAVVDVVGNANALTAAATKCVVISADGSLATAKTATENSTVTIGNKILYYKDGTVGYVEEENRFAGLRIEGSIPSVLDDKVSLSGMIKTNTSGERYVLLEQVATVGTGSVGALGTNNRAAKLAVMDGLLTTVWGVVSPNPGANYFYLSDGSDTEGIKVITPGAPGVTPNTFVTVTGAAGEESGKRVIYKK